MADIRCPHCGKDNPDFLDVCQFCQSPLKSESMLHIGERPTKKNTGELENVLPDWLKDARKQARDSAEEEAAYAAALPKVPKEEPPDLLAGLSFQSENAEEEEVPDWLLNINPAAKSKPSLRATPAQPETDLFAQSNQPQKGSQSEPPLPPSSQPAEPVQPSQPTSERDELSEWFAQASEQAVEPFAFDNETPQPHSDWGLDEQNAPPPQPTATPKEEEDLSWLHNLEATAKQTDELRSPKQNRDWGSDVNLPSQASGGDDLSWLNDLGAIPAPEQPSSPPSQSQNDLNWLDNLGGTPVEQPSSEPSKPGEDLSWLNAFKETAEPSQPASTPSSSREDLSWLNNLGATPAAQPSSESPKPQEDLSWLNAFNETPQSSPLESSQPSSQGDLSWLNNLGGVPAEQIPPQPSQPQEDLGWLNAFKDVMPPESSSNQPSSQPSPAQDDLGWLNNLQGTSDTLSAAPFADQSTEEEKQPEIPHISPFSPRQTAPLNEEENTSIPDWLKSATEGPSMPMGAGALEQFREDYKIPSQPEEPFSWKNFMQEAKPAEEQPPLSKSEPAFIDSNLFAPAGEPSVPSDADVNSLFSMEMPDWLSQAEPAKEEKPAQDIGIHAEGGEALAPVDLPSWVQAMRPMEAVISETVPNIEDQPAEREGPLAGFKGLIPTVPVGSARRPKPISLKLQTSDEQQTAAMILEQLLVGETSPRPIVSEPVLFSQRALRLVLAAFFILALSVVLALRTQIIPVSPAALPAEVDAAFKAVDFIPDNSNVLVVVDYEPALAGELEATSGPLLNHVISKRHPVFSFITTSPNGTALVERLLATANIDPAAQNYLNLGYLPGGETGVLSFLQSPHSTLPAFGDKVPQAFSGFSAVIFLTDHAESARVWIEQLQILKQSDPTVTNKPLLMVSSAQAGPLLQPYVLSAQVSGLMSGVADAARYEQQNASPGLARSYWDAFGVGILMAVVSIVLGSFWSIFARIRARRAAIAEE